MTSWHEDAFHITGPLCGPILRSSVIPFVVNLNKLLSKPSIFRCIKTPWRPCGIIVMGHRWLLFTPQFPTMNSEPVDPAALIRPAPSIHLNLSYLLTWTILGPATWLMMMDLYLSVQRIITANVVPHDHVMIWKRFLHHWPIVNAIHRHWRIPLGKGH